MSLIELSDYSLAAVGSGCGIRDFSFTLDPGDVCVIDSRDPDDALTFMRALATLIRPTQGQYRFKGQICDLKDYSAILNCKKQIGYVTPDAALISNLTIRQNLLLQRYYYENRLDLDLGDNVRALCRALDIQNKLDQRPAELNAMEIQAAIIIREITKEARVMILGQPEEYIGHAKFDVLTRLFDQLMAERLPIVFLTYDRRLAQRFANRKIIIADGSLTTQTINAPADMQWAAQPLKPSRSGH